MGPDGTILYVPDPFSPVLMISERGDTPTAVTALDNMNGQGGHRWPSHVDERHFLFTVQAARPELTGVYLANLDSRAVSRLVPQYSNAAFVDGQLLYVADGMIVARPLDPARATVGEAMEVAGAVAYTTGLGFTAFSVASNILAFAPGSGEASPTSRMQWFDRSGKPLEQLGAGSDLSSLNSYYQRISPDGRKVAVSAFQSATADLWLVDTARNVSSRFTFNDATEFSPVWSPDGTEVVYASNRGGFHNMYAQSVTKPGDERRLAEAASNQYPTDWSPNGRTIIYTNLDPKTQADIWTMPAGGGEQTPLIVTGFNEYAARLSPDGQLVAYTSDESGRPEVYVQRYPSGREKTRVSAQGGSEPQWRADGRELYFLTPNRRLNVVSVTTTPTLFAARPVKIFEVVVDTSIGSIHSWHFAPSADGQRFLLDVSSTTASTSTVVLNWRSGER